MTSNIDLRPLLELIGFMIVGMILSALLNEFFFTSITESSPANQPLEFLGAVALSLVCSFGIPSIIWLKRYAKSNSTFEVHSNDIKSYFWSILLFITLLLVGEYFMNWGYRFLELRGWSVLIEEPFNLTSVRDLLTHAYLFPLVLVVIAVIPAVVEEFFFRRIIFQYLYGASHSFWTPAILSALFFAGMHNHFLSFVPIFLLGLGLAYAYYSTKTIWTPIVLHAMNNGVSIVLLKLNIADELTTHWVLALIAALLAGYIFMNKLPGDIVENEEK